MDTTNLQYLVTMHGIAPLEQAIADAKAALVALDPNHSMLINNRPMYVGMKKDRELCAELELLQMCFRQLMEKLSIPPDGENELIDRINDLEDRKLIYVAAYIERSGHPDARQWAVTRGADRRPIFQTAMRSMREIEAGLKHCDDMDARASTAPDRRKTILKVLKATQKELSQQEITKRMAKLLGLQPEDERTARGVREGFEQLVDAGVILCREGDGDRFYRIKRDAKPVAPAKKPPAKTKPVRGDKAAERREAVLKVFKSWKTRRDADAVIYEVGNGTNLDTTDQRDRSAIHRILRELVREGVLQRTKQSGDVLAAGGVTRTVELYIYQKKVKKVDKAAKKAAEKLLEMPAPLVKNGTHAQA